MSQTYNFEVGTPPVGITVDHMEFILNVAGTLKEAADHMTEWTKSQKKKQNN